MAIIYHVTTKKEWESALADGGYIAPSLATEGFIHCSQEQQVNGVLERYFKGQSNLVKLTIDTDKLTSRYLLERSPSINEDFPHIYGPINIAAVIEVDNI